MKKLFLASIVSNTIEKLIEILPGSSDKLAVAFIPTAADPYEDKWFVDEDRDKLKEKGFNVKDVDIKGKTEQELLEELKDVDIIFVAGGNTFYLLEKSRESGFDKIVKELIQKGVIYVGSSAGATLAGPDIEPIKTLDDPSKAPSLKSFNGLNLVDFIILPHFEEKNRKEYGEIIRENSEKGYKLIILTDNQAVVVEDEEFKIVEK
ncbi:hypothetical protein CO116_00520 [Candidatus Falkowbacteria bacterium CG_4_9_14_3_um_filter_38_19]|uniref:Peptidase S51 n=1 Tax=Candidatus Falkowbacteria bacterium CG_4_9_14_3_um_filter_38_19 TaxID=1974559 RepID=A0A2M8AJG1_9BACT|nr:MAG: hypothetical protein CO116_00520 [Candidatus Falkowbacteria bacterium CG_4_9_14_3_um_filter_38_19]